jgi:hypothetical protein
VSVQHGEGSAERDESPLERWDRNTVELLNGLRVAGTGIQVLLGFLLIVPFNNRFSRLSGFERGLYLGTLVCIAVAAILLIAPSIHHRLLFRQGEKAYLVRTATRLMIVASLFMGVGLTGIMLLIADVVVGIGGAIAIAAVVGALVGAMWFVLPLARR